jgi:uncharacterized protein
MTHWLLGRLVWTILAVVALGVLAMNLSWIEGRFIYFPTSRLAAAPQDYGLAAEELSLQTEDGVRLHGWWLHGEGQRVLVWYHGNAGNISHRLQNARRFVDWFGLDIVLVDYRGYGRSEGVPNEAGLYADGRAMYDVAADRGFTPDRIVLFGRSLGSAVALDVALGRESAGVVLETPFLSVPALARVHYPFLPPSLVRTRFDNEQKIAHLHTPKLIVEAERDTIVPPSQVRRLFDLAPEPKHLFSLPGAAHNDIYATADPGYVAAWRSFLAGLANG